MILYGESIGGAITAVVAADTTDSFHKIVLQSTFSSLNDMISRFNSLLALVLWLLPEELNVVKACRKLRQRGTHIVVMHSLTDEIVPFSLFEKLKPYASKTVLLNGGHNDTTFDDNVSAAILGQ